jgi:hypothetical protein
MTFQIIRDIIRGTRIPGINVDGENVIAAGIAFDADSGHAGHLEKPGGMPPFEFSELLFSRHFLQRSAIQAKVTPKA